MKLRPALRAGDVVKLSKKGKCYLRIFPKNSTLVVSGVLGNGFDRESIIICRVMVNKEYEIHRFYRSELWFAKKNIFEKPIRILNFNKNK